MDMKCLMRFQKKSEVDSASQERAKHKQKNLSEL